MCTIMTVSTKLYNENKVDFENRILQDGQRNSDGGSLLFLDPEKPENNTIFRSMNVTTLVAMASMLAEEASDTARLFVHMRMATTRRVGIAFTHGFDDHDGRVFMHNGVIDNKTNMAVDSFNLAYVNNGVNTQDIYRKLRKEGELYANVFVINTESYNYGVIRMVTGVLYTDDKGNYSTNSIGAISRLVKDRSWKQCYMPLPRIKSHTPYNYASNSGRWDPVTRKYIYPEIGNSYTRSTETDYPQPVESSYTLPPVTKAEDEFESDIVRLSPEELEEWRQTGIYSAEPLPKPAPDELLLPSALGRTGTDDEA